MPSTLYESVKKSVIEFADLRKRNEKLEDKMIFRWKLITLGLSIVFIILVGGFSQILKAVNNLPDASNDKSFILPVLQSVATASVPTIKEANLLINGITSSLDSSGSEYEWNGARLLFDFPNSSPALDLAALTQSINSKSRLVFVVSSAGSANKFAFFAYSAYSESAAQVANVVDDAGSRFSTFFNLNSAQTLNYDVEGCPIYTRNATYFTLFSSLAITNGAATVSVDGGASRITCFKQPDLPTANAYLGTLTDLTVNPSAPITIANLQVFQLYLDESL